MSQSSNKNPFDEAGAQPEYSDEMKAQFEKRDELIHRVFQQSEAGRELLALWQEALIMTPTAQVGDDLLTVGLNEGQKSFIRNIITTIRKVES